jgi:predicted GNAT family acetyltransferase
MSAFRDNTVLSRFELAEEGHIAFASYRRRGNLLVVPHVEAAPALRGKGSAGRLMEALASHARGEGLKIEPACSYAAAWFRRHPDYRDVLS